MKWHGTVDRARWHSDATSAAELPLKPPMQQRRMTVLVTFVDGHAHQETSSTLIRPERSCCLLQHSGHKRYCHPINADWGRDLQTRFQIHQTGTDRCCSKQAIGCSSHMQLWRVGAVHMQGKRLISADFEIKIRRKYKPTHLFCTVKPDIISSQQLDIKCKLLTMTRGKLSDNNPTYEKKINSCGQG